MTKTPVIAFWLLPDKSAHAVFAHTIGELGRRLGAPIFEPHVTLCVTPPDERLAEKIVREIELPQIELTSRGIKFGDKFTKSLFLQFDRNQSLQAVADWIAPQFGVPPPAVDPHLSLLYASIATAAKKEIVATMKIPANVRFDGICVMRCQLPVEDAADVRAWESLVRSKK